MMPYRGAILSVFMKGSVENTMRHRRLFSVVQFLSYAAFGLCMTNLIPYLEYQGFNSYERGFALSGYALLTILLQLGLGYLFDKTGYAKVYISTSIVIFLVASGLLFFNKLSFPMMVIIVMLVGGFLNALCGFLDTWIMGISESLRASLSSIKSFGALGWTIGSLGSSLIMTLLGYRGVVGIIVFFSLIAFIVMQALPDIERKTTKTEVTLSDLVALLKLKDYMILILILFLLYGLVVANTTLVVDKMLSLKATPLELSLKWSIGSLLEIPMYAFGMTLIRKYGNLRMLQLSALVATAQFILFGLMTTSLGLVFVCLLQIFTTPIILITSKFLVAQIVPQYLQNSGQMIALSLFMGGSSFVIPILSGFLGIQLGYSITLILFSIVGILALLLIGYLRKQLSDFQSEAD